MAAHATTDDFADETLTIAPAKADRLFGIGLAVAVAGLVLAILTCIPFGGLRRLMLSYLVSFMFVLTIALGALFFVLLQHATKAGWSVNVRRVPELITRLFWPLLPALALPILLVTLFIPGTSPHPTLYPWAAYDHHDEAHDVAVDGSAAEAGESEVPDESASQLNATGSGIENDAYAAEAAVDHTLTSSVISVDRARHHTHIDELTANKSPYLNRTFFLVRIVFYFAVWIALSGYYYRRSVRQDSDGNPALTKQMTAASYGGLLVYAFTLTFASFDLVMSLDPHFFSTIFGGYIFAGGAVGIFAVTILAYQFLRMGGLLKRSVTVEHYHDLGKFLFAFTFFWGYVAFSQFMLIWYANIPETTYWFGVRGATSVTENLGFGVWGTGEEPAKVGWWTVISLTLLFGHLLIPFAGLLSRHVKRNLTLLGFWAGWLLVMHWVDLYWLIMPETLQGGWTLLPVVEVSCAMLVIGASVAWVAREMKSVKLRPAADPRAPESLAFHNL